MQYINLPPKYCNCIILRDKCVVTNNNLLIFRVQELVAQTEQKESTVESTTEPESTEDTINSPKPKKKKKKDKREKESAADESLNDSSLEQTSENHQTAADTAEIDSNANRHHKEKKKKKKKDKRQEADEILPSELSTNDSSRYVSEKTSRKRAAESDDGLQDAPAAKKKKNGTRFHSQTVSWTRNNEPNVTEILMCDLYLQNIIINVFFLWSICTFLFFHLKRAACISLFFAVTHTILKLPKFSSLNGVIWWN